MLRAETLLIRNETNVPLTVQAACVVNGMLRPQRPVLLQPGGVTRVALPGNKLINVYDSRLPNRSLFQGTVEASNQDQAFVLVADGMSGKVKLEPVRMPGGAMPGPGGGWVVRYARAAARCLRDPDPVQEHRRRGGGATEAVMIASFGEPWG
jgi:hypothetical protein